ncbi:hypothetical protein LEM8419_01229 [Neolewinella maritima]|uniref:DUF2382 domain-containing protein n=1 Tax=Neolewinella maritima TaxID=1383882 RepID=A0ABM9AZ96_9BACT|nr:YsnF/AvaK domain-containing protein [Neolewinella maritima]CAH1000040.1 hypothetical protein LEM8419_01229 [Neolewinella maritima]
MADHTKQFPEQANKTTEVVDESTISVIKEQLSVTTREVVTGEVNVHKTVQTETVDVPLTTIHTAYRETRVPINQVVDTMPQPRYEGKNLIVPVVREEEVITKRLVLVEEIHLIQETRSEEHTERVELHTEQAVVSRSPPTTNTTAPLPE